MKGRYLHADEQVEEGEGIEVVFWGWIIEAEIWREPLVALHTFFGIPAVSWAERR
jgi:hypothetical protein